MIFTFLLSLVYIVKSGHIFTLDVITSYNMEGNLELLEIPFKLETELEENNYLHFGGLKLHSLTVTF